jgi:ATP-binding cassette subfamily B protein
MNGNIEETIEGLKVVKVFNHEEQANADFGEVNEKFRKAATSASFFTGIMGPVSTGINNASYATIALTGGLLALTGKITIGTYFTFLGYSKQFTQPINQITNQMTTIFSALAGAERVFEVIDMESEIDEGNVTLKEVYDEDGRKWFWQDGEELIPVRGDVVFKDVDFGYVPEKRVLHNINLYARSGQKIAFVGSTGAGKTTITNLLNRFYDIQQVKSHTTELISSVLRKMTLENRFQSFCRIRIFSRARLWITSATAGWTQRTRTALRRQSLHPRIHSYAGCRRATTP